MPELPEVETVRRGLERRVLGHRISSVTILTPSVIRGGRSRFQLSLTGRRLERLRRKGKTLALELSEEENKPAGDLLIRLGMTGQLILAPQGAALLPHTHVRISFENSHEELRYRDPRRFGMMRWCSVEEAAEIFASLGPDALEITENQFEQELRGRRGAIKGWLLNQHRVAGLGNIYADEALFEARIHPLTPAGAILPSFRGSLYREIRSVLRRAINRQGTSFRDYIDIEGRPGNFESFLRVYGRTGQPCLRCGKTIRRIIVCGRSSHFCPHCQALPRTAPPR